MITITEVLPYITAGLTGFVGWLWKELVSIRAAHSKLKDEHAAHKTHVAERYVTKDDMKVSMDRVYATLDRIEKKLDERRS